MCAPIARAWRRRANRYDTPEHERWYRRFWTGLRPPVVLHFRRAELERRWSASCWSRAARPSGVLLPKACRLGQLIGLEWSREKSIRKIDTADLRAFNTTLEASSDTLKGLDKIELGGAG
jgi:hypothetical protein